MHVCAILVYYALVLESASTFAAESLAQTPAKESWLTYTNDRVGTAPWSIHVVRVERSNNPAFEIQSAHARGGALGLETLSSQVRNASPRPGSVAVAVNGDFYKRDGFYAGDSRGIQIVNGELISAPAGGACFWIDAGGQPHTTNVTPQFQVTWPNNTTTPFGLNEERPYDRAILYTPSAGPTTQARGGRECILESATPGPQSTNALLPLQIGKSYSVRVREVRDAGNSPIAPGTVVLSLGAGLRGKYAMLTNGTVLTLSTATSPGLAGAKCAIGGGPVLVHAGKKQKIDDHGESYEFRSMLERHPRTAIGWSPNYFYFVEVDGRQPQLSVGMTLPELSNYFAKLGCEEAMNLDGGGSATLWYNGKVRNSPCDRQERAVANSLLVVRKASPASVPAPPASQ